MPASRTEIGSSTSKSCSASFTFQKLVVPSSTDVYIHPVLAVKMDRVTAVDKVLFSVALRGFLSEIRSLEARAGHRVLCPHVLKEAEPKLAYITNVTALYEIS